MFKTFKKLTHILNINEQNKKPAGLAKMSLLYISYKGAFHQLITIRKTSRKPAISPKSKHTQTYHNRDVNSYAKTLQLVCCIGNITKEPQRKNPQTFSSYYNYFSRFRILLKCVNIAECC